VDAERCGNVPEVFSIPQKQVLGAKIGPFSQSADLDTELRQLVGNKLGIVGSLAVVRLDRVQRDRPIDHRLDRKTTKRTLCG
jgi:hypothetical protein